MLCRAREKGERFTACLCCESMKAMILPQIEETGHNFWRMRFSASTGLVWEGNDQYASLDDALRALDAAIAEWIGTG
jgi:hypothetical protein